MSIGTALILGLVQGIAEFLPISSSGHLAVIENLLGLDYTPEENLLFDVLLHVGTLVTVCIFYIKDIKAIASDLGGFLLGRESVQDGDGRLKPTIRLLFLIVLGTLPLFVILPFHSKLETLFDNTAFIAFAFIVTGAILFISGMLAEGRKNEKTSSFVDALTIGAAQAVATIPGISRSGVTITMGLACGFKRDFAVRFSFLLSIPAVLGSTIVTLIDAISAGVDFSNLPVYLVGMIVAAVVGYVALTFLKNIVSSGGLAGFSYYCFFAGILTIILSLVTKTA